MKKLVFALAVVFSMSFVACGNKEAANENAECCDSTNCTETVANEAATLVNEVVDSAKVDSVVNAVVEKVDSAVVK